MPHPDDLVISGVGMATSLGFDAVTSCAAARAGLSRAEVLDFWVEDPEALESVPVPAHTLGWYTDGFAELGRLVQLGRPAVHDVVRSAALSRPELERTAWIVNVADGAIERQAEALRAATAPEPVREAVRPPYERLRPWYEEQLVPRLVRALPDAPARAPSKLVFGGPAGVAVALAEAARLLRERRVTTCLVGGIDSLADLRWLDALSALGLLKTPVDAVGWTPGEAAVFLCVETARTAQARGATVRAVLGEPAAGRDPSPRGAETPPTGVTLSEVVRAALGGAPTAVAYAGLCGDAAAASEWGRAWVRLAAQVTFADVVYPATSFGATGAAAGFVSAALALHSFARGAGAPALVWEASDDGLRGAVTLSPA